jgi:hypothetical protein
MDPTDPDFGFRIRNTGRSKDFFTAQYSDDNHEAYSPLRILDLGSLPTLLLPKRVFVDLIILQRFGYAIILNQSKYK